MSRQNSKDDIKFKKMISFEIKSLKFESDD